MGQKRIVYVDYLKVVAMFGVIMSHSLASALQKPPLTHEWNIANAVLGIVSPSVGIFFMVSGALILSSSNTDDLGYLFRHRLVKVGIPFLLWAGATVASFGITAGDYSFKIWLHKMLLMYHELPTVAFWFMYPLIGFYLLSPMLKALVDHTSTKVLDYIILLWFVSNIFFPFIVNVTPEHYGMYFDQMSQNNMILLDQTFGYFLIGYRLHKAPIKKPSAWLNGILTVILLVLTIGINYANVKYHLNIPVIGYTSVLAVFLAAEIFLTAKKWSDSHPISAKQEAVITTISSLAYGIYLTHGIIMQQVERIFKVTNFFYIFLLTSFFCLVITYIISKIPKIRYFLLGIN